MASKQEYLNMMKRMDRMGEERIPASMNMGIDSMMNKPVVANKGIADPNFKNLNLNIPEISAKENMGIVGEILQSGKGSMSNAQLDAIKNSAMAGMSAGMTGNILEEMKKLDPKGVVREDEMMKMLGDLTMSDREAIEGLTSMGITLEDALEAILGVSEADTMPEGALGSLPSRDTNSVVRENENMFDADRTQSLDMQKEAMGT